MSLWLAVYLIYNLVLMLSIERFMGVFFEKRRTPRLVFVGSYLFYFVASSLMYLLLNIPIVAMLTAISTYFVISLNYESSMTKRFVSSIAFFVLALVSEIGVMLIFAVSGFDSVIEGVGIVYIGIEFFIVHGFLIYLFSCILRKFKNVRNNKISSPLFWVLALVVPLVSLLLIVVTVTQLTQGVLITVAIIIFAINIFVLYYQDHLSATYEEKLKSALEAQEKDYYMLQCKLMQESVEQVKALRHDMKLHLSTAKDFAAESKAQEAAEYLNSLLGKISKTEVYSDTGNLVFDSIINFKLNNANIENFKPELYLLLPPETGIEVPDIITILGNLLDNAIDALQHTTDKTLKLDIEYSKDCLLIKVDNAFDGNIKYKWASGGNPNHIVSRKKGRDHGYGLRNIREAVEKYNGHIDISHEGNMFSVGVLLYSPGGEDEEELPGTQGKEDLPQ